MSRDAAEIQPLVPALQNWWMKIHVPANFIGYGTFALAAMAGVAYLFKAYGLLADRLPPLEVLDDLMYKAIAVGFAFFTIDADWLHLRRVKGVHVLVRTTFLWRAVTSQVQLRAACVPSILTAGALPALDTGREALLIVDRYFPSAR